MSRSNENKLIHIPCTQGMNQAFNQRAAPAGTFYEVKNGRIVASGVVEKRPGLTSVAGSTNLPDNILVTGNGGTNHTHNPSFVTQVGDAPCIGTTMGAAFCWDSGTDTFHVQGRFSTAQPKRKRNGLMGSVLDSNKAFGEKPAAQAVNGDGYLLYAAVTGSTGGSIAHITIENPDGVRIFYLTHTGKSKIQALATGDTFYIIMQNGTDITAQSLEPDGTDVNVGTQTTVATLNSSSQHWDTTAWTSTTWGLVHQSASGTIRVDSMSGVTSGGNTTFSVTGNCPVSAWVDSSSRIWVGYYNDPTVTGNVRYRIYSFSAGAFSSVLGETTIRSAADVYGPPLFGQYRDLTPGNGSVTTVAFYVHRYVESGGNELRATYWGTANTSGTASTSNPLWHVLPISKPDNYNRVWVMTSNGSDNFELQRALLIRYTSAWIIELASPNMAGTLEAYDPSSLVSYFHAIATGSSSSFFAFPFVLNVINDEPLAKIEVYEYQTAEQYAHIATERIGNMAIIAGQPTVLHGRPFSQYSTTAFSVTRVGAAEIGFAQAPTLTEVTSQNTSDGASHSYRVMYDWADAYGRRHRSPPSPPVTVSTRGANMSVTVRFTSVELSQRTDSTFFEAAPQYLVFRTLDGGTTYHRVPFTELASDASDGFLAITDSFEDSQISSNEILYTDGGVLPDTLAPSCRFMASSEDRLWCGGLWDPQIIQCSKTLVPGEAIAFTDDASHQVFLPGDCTGLAYMDGQIVAFTKNEIYLISGDGPDDRGVGSFPSPRKLAQGIGCTDERSVLETNIGIVFLSAQGFMLLPRGFGSVEFIGAAVRDLTQGATDSGVFDAAAKCLSAAVLAKADGYWARFLLAEAADTSSATALTLDLNSGRWFWDDYGSLALAEIGVAFDEFVLIQRALTTAATGPIWIESTSSGDGSTYIAQLTRLSWIYPFGPGGHGHVKAVQIAFEVIGNCTVTLTVTTDNNTVQTGSWDVTTATTIQYREIVLKNMKCTAVKIQVSDAATSGTATRGIKLLSTTLEVEADGGRRLLASGERA